METLISITDFISNCLTGKGKFYSIKNHTWFYQKHHVVLPKTSCGFIRNITWFCRKPHVVLPETTRGFTNKTPRVFKTLGV